MSESQSLADPVALVDGLDIDEIIDRMNTLDEQMDALRALLRVARARNRRALREREDAKQPVGT
jgi:hypothetical protein